MTRALTAAVIIGVLLGVLYMPPVAFAVAASVVLLIGWNEFSRLLQALGVDIAAAPGALVALALANSFLDGPSAAMLVLLVAVPLLALATLRDNYGDPRRLTFAIAGGFAGLAWLAIPMGAQIGIRYHNDGIAWLLFLYASVALGDSAAYYGGSRFGQHRLAPDLSPKKSIEGSVFGIVGSAAGGLALSPWIPGLPLWQAALVGAGLGLVGQAGDLIESSLKRTAGRKDSADLLPGHGGVLDRIDAHLPAGALLYAILRTGVLG